MQKQKLVQHELNKSLNKKVSNLKDIIDQKMAANAKIEHVGTSVVVNKESGTVVSELTHNTESKSSSSNKSDPKVAWDTKTKKERKDRTIKQRWKQANYRRSKQDNLQRRGRLETYSDGSYERYGLDIKNRPKRNNYERGRYDNDRI